MANVSLWWKMDGLIKNATRKLDIHQPNISERLKFMIPNCVTQRVSESSTSVLAPNSQLLSERRIDDTLVMFTMVTKYVTRQRA